MVKVSTMIGVEVSSTCPEPLYSAAGNDSDRPLVRANAALHRHLQRIAAQVRPGEKPLDMLINDKNSISSLPSHYSGATGEDIDQSALTHHLGQGDKSSGPDSG